LRTRWVDPSQISGRTLSRFSESRSLHFQAMPVQEIEHRLVVVFREPPTSAQLAEMSRELRIAVEPFLARPANIAMARNRAYPRLVLPPSPLSALADRFREAAGLNTAAFLQVITEQEITGLSLPDLLVEKNLVRPGDARKLWAECIGCAPLDAPELKVHSESFYKVGPTFWWLHRMLPADWTVVVTAFRPHPDLQPWLANKTGVAAKFAAELPHRLELAARPVGVTASAVRSGRTAKAVTPTFEVDPDQILIDCLLGKGLLRREQLPDVAALRRLTADSASKWLLLHRMVPEEQLHQTFAEICYLPPAQPWKVEEVERLLPILPPGFAREHACYPLQENNGNIRFGLGQMPSPAAVRALYNRLGGYGLLFQALSFVESMELRKVAE
jgi:hypothetical protein